MTLYFFLELELAILGFENLQTKNYVKILDIQLPYNIITPQGLIDQITTWKTIPTYFYKALLPFYDPFISNILYVFTCVDH